MRPIRLSEITRKKVVSGLAVGLFLLVLWVFLWPASLGGSTTLVTVSGTSMQPGMYTGDLAVVRDTDDYAVGEVIAYHPKMPNGEYAAVVIHRIVGGNATSGFVVQGDNNGFEDPWQPVPEQVVGELWFHVPDAGTVVAAMCEPVMAASILAALTVFLVLVGGGSSEADDVGESESQNVGAQQ